MNVDVQLDKTIKWPNNCAICNKTASSYASTNYRNIDGFFLVALRETTRSMKYPVCSRHKWIARFYSFVTNQAFVTGLVMAITVPFLILVPIIFTNILDPKLHNAAAIFVYITFLFGILYWKFRNPIKIIKIKNDTARIRIRNEQYAAEFKKINS